MAGTLEKQMRLKVVDNRDTRWSDDDNAAIDQKVDEALELMPRVTIKSLEGGALTEPERRLLLINAFREIARATNVDTVACAPATLLDAFSTIAFARGHDIRAMLTHLLRVFLIAYSETATSDEASVLLTNLKNLATKALNSPGSSRAPWKPLPDTEALDAADEALRRLSVCDALLLRSSRNRHKS